MPKAVVLQTDDEPPTNLSAEAYSAWTGKGTSVVGPMIHGRWLDHIQMFGGAGGPRPRPRRPSSVTLKEHLDSTQVEAMLKVETPWKLIVRKTDDDLYVIDRSKLESAWAQDASGTVRVELDRLSVGEKAAYDAAKEQFEPKAGIKRLQAGLGAPVTNIALLAAVGTGGIVGVNKFGDKAIEWTLPLYLAVFFGVVSVLLSFLLNSLVRRRTVNLARLDLLENDAAASRRPAVLTNAVILLFAAAIACLLWALVTAPDVSTPEDVDFGSMSTQTQGDATTATFTVTWKGIPDDVTTVRATVAAPGQLAQKGTEQNVKGSASHTFEGIPVRPGSDVRVSTQGFDKDDQPIGDKVTHTYPDVR